jgi:hypothetical protein
VTRTRILRRDVGSWGREYDPARLARLELRMWQAYDRRQPARLFQRIRERQAGSAPADFTPST